MSQRPKGFGDFLLSAFLGPDASKDFENKDRRPRLNTQVAPQASARLRSSPKAVRPCNCSGKRKV